MVPFRTSATKVSQSAGSNTRVGPVRSFESRTATRPWAIATSMQLPVLLSVLFRHTARDRSTIPHPFRGIRGSSSLNAAGRPHWPRAGGSHSPHGRAGRYASPRKFSSPIFTIWNYYLGRLDNTRKSGERGSRVRSRQTAFLSARSGKGR